MKKKNCSQDIKVIGKALKELHDDLLQAEKSIKEVELDVKKIHQSIHKKDLLQDPSIIA